MPNTYDLAGKTALVTGAARGIGRSVAETLLGNGCAVTIWDLDQADVRGATAVRVDVSQSDQIAAAAAALPSRLDILVNVAGYLGQAGPFVQHPPDRWKHIIDVNLLGTIQVTQALLPIMIAQGSGKIINLGSLAGKEGAPGIAVYSAASAGVIAFTKALSREIAQHKILVNCVAPGPVDTDMIRSLGPDVVAQMTRDSPLGRLGSPSEVAELVAWLCTDASNFSTGAVFDASGGRARY